MRARYLVAYDVSDPKRLRLVHKTVRGFGEAMQYSVFVCDLSDHEKVLLRGAVAEIIHADEDRVMIVHLGPADGRGAQCFEILGRQHAAEDPGAVIV